MAYWEQGRLLRFILVVIVMGLILIGYRDTNTQSFSDQARCATTSRPAIADELPAGFAPPLADMLVYDTFSDPEINSLSADENDYVRYTFDSNAYLIEVHAAPLLAWSLLEDSYHNVLIQVDTMQIDGSPMTASSLLFRYQDNENFYLFNVASNGFYNLELFKDGVHYVLIPWTPSDAIERLPTSPTSEPHPAAVHNLLGVALHAEQITLFVNGTKLEDTLDDTFRRGSVGLAVNTLDQQTAMVCFDNVLIADNNE